jgi:DNA-binding transcriptional regulator LsrR (DeoR family)
MELDDFGVTDLILASLYYFGPMNQEQIIKKLEMTVY